MEILRIVHEHQASFPEVTGADYLQRAHTHIKLASEAVDGSAERQLRVAEAVGNFGLFLECPTRRLGNLRQRLDALSEDPSNMPMFWAFYDYTQAIRKYDELHYTSAIALAAYRM